MSQTSILNFLEKNREKWFTTVELGQKMNVGSSSINRAIRKLRQYRLVDSKNLKNRFDIRYVWYYKYKKNDE